MTHSFANVALVVRDYDEAIAFYTGVLGFVLAEDVAMGNGKRWVRVVPSGGGAGLILAKASGPHQETRVGDQTGGRVFLFLHTNNFMRDYEAWRAKGVEFIEGPREEEYGTVGVFHDLYGNKWDLIEKR